MSHARPRGRKHRWWAFAIATMAALGGLNAAGCEVLPGHYVAGAAVDAALAPAVPAIVEPAAVEGPTPDRLIDDDLVEAAFSPIAWIDGVSARERWMLAANDASSPGDECPALLDHSFRRLQGGKVQSLCDYRGKVLLVVNTASYCGYTHQYEGLEALYRKYRDRGLVVVGFPSNDFGGQEPGSNNEIAEFCRTTYGVEFPMFEKASVSNADGNPMIAELGARTGERPQWNFHKYLIDRRGQKVASFKSAVAPDSRELVRKIEQLLAEPATPARS